MKMVASLSCQPSCRFITNKNVSIRTKGTANTLVELYRGSGWLLTLYRFLTVSNVLPSPIIDTQAWIALEAAGANYQLEQVSLYGAGGKPDWFWKLNPKGQVPVLVVNNNESEKEIVLADSDLILDEIQRVVGDATKSQLYDTSNDETTTKQVRAFRKCLSEFLPIGKKAVLGGNKDQMWSKLQELDELIEGPYVAGNHMTVADCAAFPFLWRIQQEYSKAWKEHNCSNISKWLDRCSRQPAFSKSIQSSWWWWW